MTEVRCQRADDRGQMTEGRGQMTEDRGQRTEGGSGNAEVEMEGHSAEGIEHSGKKRRWEGMEVGMRNAEIILGDQVAGGEPY